MTEPLPSQQRLSRAIQLNAGFQVIFAFGPLEAGRAAVAGAVANASRATQRPVLLHWFLPAYAAEVSDSASEAVPEVWVVECDGDERSTSEVLQRLNRTRDSMGTHPATTLVVVLREDDGAAPARVAPDLWSVRTLSFSTGDIAAPPQDAALMTWRDACDAAFERKLSERDHARPLYATGTYRFAYRIRGARRLASSEALRELMRGIGGWTGWRPWWVPQNEFRPYSADDGIIECWMLGDEDHLRKPARADFWRASKDGCFYLVRGYDEDGTDKLERGRAFSFGLPVWRLGEALLHAKQVADRVVPGHAVVDFTATWTGLTGRHPTDWPSRFFDAYEFDEPSARESVTSTLCVDADELAAEPSEVLARALQPLYDAFMAAPSKASIQRELDDMLARPVRGPNRG